MINGRILYINRIRSLYFSILIWAGGVAIESASYETTNTNINCRDLTQHAKIQHT